MQQYTITVHFKEEMRHAVSKNRHKLSSILSSLLINIGSDVLSSKKQHEKKKKRNTNTIKAKAKFFK